MLTGMEVKVCMLASRNGMTNGINDTQISLRFGYQSYRTYICAYAMRRSVRGAPLMHSTCICVTICTGKQCLSPSPTINHSLFRHLYNEHTKLQQHRREQILSSPRSTATLATMALPIAHAGQSAVSLYGLYTSYVAITNLQKYEKQTEKAAKYSGTAEHQLHKTRTTQASGALAVCYYPSRLRNHLPYSCVVLIQDHK